MGQNINIKIYIESKMGVGVEEIENFDAAKSPHPQGFLFEGGLQTFVPNFHWCRWGAVT